MERKFLLDTNLFIQGLRDPDANASLQRFHQLFATFEYLSVVVAQELRAGVRSHGADTPCTAAAQVGQPPRALPAARRGDWATVSA